MDGPVSSSVLSQGALERIVGLEGKERGEEM
jgi:hypothetical protein